MKKLFTIAMIFGLSTMGWAENGSGIGDIPVTNGNSYTKEVNKTTTVKKEAKAAVATKATVAKTTKAKKGTYYREGISMINLPKFTRQYMKENFSLRQVREVARVFRGSGDVIYEIDLRLDGEKYTIKFDQNGEPLPEYL